MVRQQSQGMTHMNSRINRTIFIIALTTALTGAVTPCAGAQETSPGAPSSPELLGRCGTLTMIAKLSADVGMGVLTGVIDSYRVAFGSIDFQNPDGLTVKDRLINKTHAFPHQLIDIPRLDQSEREQRYGQYC